MARTEPGKRPEIDPEIAGKILRIMEERRYRGSFASFVETVLDKFADGLLAETGNDVNDIPAIKGRRIGVGRHQNTA